MELRSTNDSYVHYQGEVLCMVNSSHGVRLGGGSTGGVVEPIGDDANVSLRVRGRGTGGVILGSTNQALTLNSSAMTVGSNSTTAIGMIQRFFVQFTVPAISSASGAESTVTVTGLTTNGFLILQNRLRLNSTVIGLLVHARCSTADELTIEYFNCTQSSISGSTQSGYLLQVSF